MKHPNYPRILTAFLALPIAFVTTAQASSGIFQSFEDLDGNGNLGWRTDNVFTDSGPDLFDSASIPDFGSGLVFNNAGDAAATDSDSAATADFSSALGADDFFTYSFTTKNVSAIEITSFTIGIVTESDTFGFDFSEYTVRIELATDQSFTTIAASGEVSPTFNNESSTGGFETLEVSGLANTNLDAATTYYARHTLWGGDSSPDIRIFSDDVVLTAVPEPSAAALVLGGFAFAMTRCSRRRKRLA